MLQTFLEMFYWRDYVYLNIIEKYFHKFFQRHI